MSFHIRAIILFGPSGQRRELLLKPSTLNVITGASDTGKTALTRITDYVLGSSDFTVPGIIRTHVTWYALVLAFAEHEVFVARAAPQQRRAQSTVYHFDVGRTVEIPDVPNGNSNLAAVLEALARMTAVEEHTYTPPEGQTRDPVTATLRHSLAYVFQPQNEIAEPTYLLHKQNDTWVARDIKALLPYFVGAVGLEYVGAQARLAALRKRQRELQKRVDARNAARETGLGRAGALLSEARAVGVTVAPNPDDFDQAVALLRVSLEVVRSSLAVVGVLSSTGDEYDRLQFVGQELRARSMLVRRDVDVLRDLQHESTAYEGEMSSQAGRLRSLQVASSTGDACPLCEQILLDGHVPALDELRAALARTESQLQSVRNASPRVTKAMEAAERELDQLKVQISENRQALLAVLEVSQRARELRADEFGWAYVGGRISAFLETLSPESEAESLEAELSGINAEITELQLATDPDRIDQYMRFFERRLADLMGPWGRRLELEYEPLRFDSRRVTVVADGDSGPQPMSVMGSAENWVGCHLVALFALHAWFVTNGRPVPRVLFLDQPSQVYFPAEASLDVGVDSLPDEDRAAVGRILRFVFDISAEFGIQVILTEHADIQEPWFQDAVVERWRAGRALIPQSWFQSDAK